MAPKAPKLPPDIVDCHHHFYEPSKNAFSGFLSTLGAPDFPPEKYTEAKGALKISRSVHIEAMPDEGVKEVAWVASLMAAGRCPTVKAIVAKCDLSQEDAGEVLDALIAAAPGKVRGIRYILDYDGPFGEDNGTHPQVSIHGLDYLRTLGKSGPAEAFERGFALLAGRGLSFDLQCAPAQLSYAAGLAGRHPKTKVAICHCGKVRHLTGRQGDNNKIATWREGMTLLAQLPNVYCKISMIGFCVPGWSAHPHQERRAMGLLSEILSLFGPRRCMVASNWHGTGAAANADGADETEITMTQFYAAVKKWADGPLRLSAEDQSWLFAKTARDFYRLEKTDAEVKEEAAAAKREAEEAAAKKKAEEEAAAKKKADEEAAKAKAEEAKQAKPEAKPEAKAEPEPEEKKEASPEKDPEKPPEKRAKREVKKAKK